MTQDRPTWRRIVAALKPRPQRTRDSDDETRGSPGRGRDSVMSCQSLTCDAEPMQNFHRSVHFSLDNNERKSMECSLEYHGDDTSDISGAWGSSWSSQAMSRSAPASCPAPMSTGPTSLESTASAPEARFPRLEECAHFHYGRVQLGGLCVRCVQTDTHSAHEDQDQDNLGWVTISVRPHCDKGDRATLSNDTLNQILHKDQNSDNSEWMVTRSAENFKMLDNMLHRCIYDRKVSGLPDLSIGINEKCLEDRESYESLIGDYLHHFSIIADDTINCGPILNWFQMDNKGHKLLVASEDCNSINTPAVAAAYSVRRYVSQARDEISFEVGDMISVIDMPGPSESTWWRGKRGFRVGFFPQQCVAVIGDKVPRNMKQPPPIVGSVSVAPIKPVLRKHGKLISLFRSFILSRPSRRSLRQQGILRERVFGCDLGEHLLNSGHDVPQVLTWCASIIEEHGCVDGIYRLSGASSATQRLRLAFDEERPPSNPPSPLDVHAVASLLKMYFRELPNPLCTFQLYTCFVLAVKLTNAEDGSEIRRLDDSEKLIRMRETVVKLPPPHYRTLAFLMRHLHKMSLLGGSTGMTARNMGIVWAPNLLRSPLQEFSLSGVAIQVVVTEFLICYADLIFSDEQPLQEVSEIRDSNESPDSMDGQMSTLCRRPKSLPLATPTRLLSLEEARNKQQLRPSSTKEPHYIEVGEGPNSLPRYHTIIQLPSGSAKRGLKRSPSGWRGIFFRASKHRTLPVPSSTQPIISEPQQLKIIESSNVMREINKTEEKTQNQNMTVDDIVETRSSRSCESLASEVDNLPPLALPKETQLTTSHNRSASCDSYFETSLAELAGMQLRLTSQEREMDIFSEDDTTRQVWNKDESSSGDTTAEPSPIKFPRTVQKSLSPPNIKYSLPDSNVPNILEEQLSDLLFIDCSTPEHTAFNNLRSKTEDTTNCINKQNKSLDNYDEKDRYLTVNQARTDNDSSTYATGSPQHSTTIKVRMRVRGSPKKAPRTNLSRHSHCGPSIPSKVEVTPHRHSTLIRVDWSESDHLRDPNPDLCGYTQLQSDSDTSLQITESKDSLAKRLIESKESLLSTTVEENSNVIDNCLQLESKPQCEGIVIDCKNNSHEQNNRSDSCEGVTETFTGIITKRASRENLDGSIPSHSVEKLYESNKLNLNCAKIITNANSDNFEKFFSTSNGLDPTKSDTMKAEKIMSDVPISMSENKIACVFENSIKSTLTDVDNENRYSITVTPNDENCTHTIADSVESSLSPTNISYQNLNRLSMISGDSCKAGLSKESTPTYSSHEQERTEEIYECFTFSKPSYIHLASSSGGSSPTSPQNKSPLKSTINITYKSPTKDPMQYLKNNLIAHDEKVEDEIYEDVANAENNALPSVSDSQDKTPIVNKTTFADLVMQESLPVFNIKSESNVDSDIYNKVKFFRQSVHEVNSLIMESDKGQQSDSPCDDSLDINNESNKLGGNDEYEIVDYNLMPPTQRHNYENVDLKNNIGKSNSNPEGLTPLTELCLDRHLLENQSNIEKVDHAYENFDVKTSIDQIIHRSNKTDNALKLNLENKTFIKVVGESDKENSDENENIAPSSIDYINKRSSVKQLAHKFESPTENKGPFFFDRSSRNNLSSSEKIKEGSLYSFDRNKAVSFCEGRAKINLTGRTVPCVRVKNNRLAKHSNNARSLDENAFVKEFGNQILHKDHISEIQINDPNTICNRRKSLEALKSLNQPKKLPDLNLNTECNRKCSTRSDLHLPLTTCHSEGFLKGVDSNCENRMVSITPTTENKICLVQARFSPKKNKTKQFSSMKLESSNDFQNKSSDNIPCDELLDDDKREQLSRERIEKYKEERRLILREKYSSQSFRGVNDLPLTAKVKDSKMDDEEFEGVQLRNPGKLERRNTADAVQRSKFSSARMVSKQNDIMSELSHMNVKTVAEADGLNENFLDNIPSRIGSSSSNADKPRITGMQRKFSLDGASLCKSQDPKICVKNSDNIVVKNVERPKTLNTFGIPTSIAISEQRCLPGISKDEPSSSLTSKKEKRSPSFNIKDMAAKFEQKSLNN